MDRQIEGYANRMEAYEASEDAGRNPAVAEGRATVGDVIASRFSRRGVLKGMLGSAAIAAVAGAGMEALLARSARAATAAFGFTEIAHGVDETHHVAPGYSADILIRWGDPVVKGAPAFDPMNQTADAQEMQFGYNNDFLGLVPLPMGSAGTDRALLVVNHEYTSEEVMHPTAKLPAEPVTMGKASHRVTRDLAEIEMAAHGGTVVEVVRDGGTWRVVAGSPYNRRITPRSTEMVLTGPAAGHDRLKTEADPAGTRCIGMLNNCAGGMTPWGTWLSAEENFHGYFWGQLDESHAEYANYKRYGVPGNWYGWGAFFDRFDIAKEPNEANRYGWMVEIDPYDPASTPKKRTALGRFKHEGGGVIINKDGRAVVYMGDDERFDYLYRFVSAGTYNPNDRAANMDLLDEGTLSVARFDADGTVTWLPMVQGEGPLTAENGFASQADVVIEARRAGDLLGATPMDRPEDVDVQPQTGRIYVMLTNNTRRKAEQVDPANPRAENAFGHIVEITAPDMDHAAGRMPWEILVKCGDPAKPELGAMWNPATTGNGWFAAPDNCAVDHQGRLWVTTDQGSGWAKTGTADGVWAMETDGALRGTGRMFFRVPVGAEMCGPCFTPDDTALFVAVQHPATDGVDKYAPFGRKSTFEDPATRWPDFKDGVPPRPSVVVITKNNGGVIGS